MSISNGPVPKHRNRNYEETHVQLIEKAGELIAQSGADGVSLSGLARATGINRSTVYYHFDSRESLMAAAQQLAREKLAAHDDANVSCWVGIDNISGVFQRDPDVIAAWIDDYLAVGDIRERYPHWDRLVAQIGDAFAELAADEPCDTEVYCALMLNGAHSVPRKPTNAVHPFESLERILGQLNAKAAMPAENDSKAIWSNGPVK